VDISLQYITLEGDPPRFIAIVRDISEQQRHKEEIEALAFFDPLTGLPNRSLIQPRLENVMSECSASGCYGAVMITDLDDFKSVNDTLGHRGGDQLLVEISGRFAEALGDSGSISRLGGDEFLVVMTTPHSDRDMAVRAVTDTARALHLASTEPTRTLGNARPISTSIGVVMFNDTSISSSELMRMADIAMYDAKKKGRNRESVFDDAMQQHLLEEHQLTGDLIAAIERQNELVPWFQTKVDQQGQITGFEALARWHHPERGLLNPGCFINLAENIEDSIQQMQQLRALGVRFSLDDFGTGYSSLSYLRQLPIDELKIDKSFVDTLMRDPESHSIVEVILKLADTLGLWVIAEGIEREDQWHTLRSLGCPGFQGYLFSRPQPPEVVLETLRPSDPT
jgi:diguanylate cyclase (GGDEF)-like protein